MRIDNLIGQAVIKQQVKLQAEFCHKFNGVFPHTLLIASAGQGKTTMANAIAELIGKPVVQAYCPTIKTSDDLMQLFKRQDGSWIQPGTVLFLDEIHALSLSVAEHLYTLMETFTLVEDGVSKPFPKFTLLAGTTEPHMMSKPLRDRFVNQFVFEAYTDDDMKEYITNLGYAIMLPTPCKRLAKIANYTPRIVNSFMKKLHMYSQVKKLPFIDDEHFTEFLRDNGYTPNGLTAMEDKYMRVLASQKKASVATLANLLGMKQSMVATIVEPSLLAKGLIELTYGGRSLTDEGYTMYGGR